MGFSVPPRLRLERWALTPPFHPYPGRCRPWRYILCGTVRRDASRRALPRVSAGLTANGYAASRPVVFGLSSPGLRQERFPTLPKSKTCRRLGQRAVIARGVVRGREMRRIVSSEGGIRALPRPRYRSRPRLRVAGRPRPGHWFRRRDAARTRRRGRLRYRGQWQDVPSSEFDGRAARNGRKDGRGAAPKPTKCGTKCRCRRFLL